jgi:hypothetical protein
MWFHFCTANHNPIGRATLFDMFDWFKAGLLDLGHKVTLSTKSIEPRAINILWDSFIPKILDELNKAEITYGIIATEIPDGIGFNWRTEPEWIERFNAFTEVAQCADFIWTTVESTVPFYSKLCPTAFVELGFSSRLVPDYINKKPEVDFSFFGLRTPYRLDVVEHLRKYANVCWPEKFLTTKEVGKLVAITKVGLNFKQSEKWPIPSPTRLGRFMMSKRDIASEYTKEMTRQGSIIGLPTVGQDFVQFAMDRLSSNWQERAEASFENYRIKMPMGDIMENVLGRTITRVKKHTITQIAPIDIGHIIPPKLLSVVQNWNIVYWNCTYFAVKQGTGDIDVREGLENLRKKIGKDSIYCASSMSQISNVIKDHETRIAYITPPKLISVVQNWNIVYWNCTYFAVKQGTGDIDVREGLENLRKKIGKDSIHCASSMTQISDVIEGNNLKDC